MGERRSGIPMDPRDSVIVPIFEDKGDIKDCWHYRGIKIIYLDHTMEICERIIDRSLKEETSIGKEQFDFMPGRGKHGYIYLQRGRTCGGETPGDSKGTARGLEVFEMARVCRHVRFVRDTYGGARTQVITSAGITGKTTVRVELHQGCSLTYMK